MPQNYVPIFIFIAFIAILIPVTLLAAKLVRPDNPHKTKLMPYECGIEALWSGCKPDWPWLIHLRKPKLSLPAAGLEGTFSFPLASWSARNMSCG